MTTRYILQVTLLLCFSTTTLSGSYNLLYFQQKSSNLACLKLLLQLNGTPEFCLKDRMDFKFPEEIRQPQHFQKEDTALIIYEMLQQIFGILRRDFSSTGWNKTIIENLSAELYQQMDHLETTLEENMEKENSVWENMVTILRLKNYYLRIVRYLKAKGFSNCSWTVVQIEILRNLSFIIRLTGFLHN
ncbi:PREDICTED: interferon beta [Chrysochloris asiatica]|uniref:Interferon beta n=1 Tax=Chrysochloris asiatica TaxID=185453 RepID=A0A9B0TGL7_CHRAS|nr:PREDICTED: interferon beta [Chrysochloris asiatica]